MSIQVGVEEQESQKRAKDQGTHEGKRHMETKNAMPRVAAPTAKQLIRRSGVWLHTRYSIEVSGHRMNSQSGHRVMLRHRALDRR